MTTIKEIIKLITVLFLIGGTLLVIPAIGDMHSDVAVSHNNTSNIAIKLYEKYTITNKTGIYDVMCFKNMTGEFNDCVTTQLYAKNTTVNTTVNVTEYDKFSNFLHSDNVSNKTYNNDQTKPYIDRYICSHFAKDLMTNARAEGFTIYAVHLTGSARAGTTDAYDMVLWHMINAVKLDGKWYFVEPQTDSLYNIENGFDAYGYEYAWIGQNIFISRNDAWIDSPIRDEPGLIDGDFIYLKGLN